MHKTLFVTCLLVGALIAPPTQAQASPGVRYALSDVAERSLPSVVTVLSTRNLFPGGGNKGWSHPFFRSPKRGFKSQGLGSGVIVSGWIDCNEQPRIEDDDSFECLHDGREWTPRWGNRPENRYRCDSGGGQKPHSGTHRGFGSAPNRRSRSVCWFPSLRRSGPHCHPGDCIGHWPQRCWARGIRGLYPDRCGDQSRQFGWTHAESGRGSGWNQHGNRLAEWWKPGSDSQSPPTWRSRSWNSWLRMAPCPRLARCRDPRPE